MPGEAYERGMAMRRQVLGDDWVNAAMASGNEFSQPLQELVTEYAWGTIWSRPGLPLKIRSMLNLAMLTALNRPQELRGHVRGAINNGCTREEIQEVLLQATVYCGAPAGVDAFRVANEALKDL